MPNQTLDSRLVDLVNRIDTLKRTGELLDDAKDWAIIGYNLGILSNPDLHNSSRAYAAKRIAKILDPYEKTSSYRKSVIRLNRRRESGWHWLSPIGTWTAIAEKLDELVETRSFYLSRSDPESRAIANRLDAECADLADQLAERLVKDRTTENADAAYAAKQKVQAERANQEMERMMALDYAFWYHCVERMNTARMYDYNDKIAWFNANNKRGYPGIDRSLYNEVLFNLVDVPVLQDLAKQSGVGLKELGITAKLGAIEKAFQSHRLSPIFQHEWAIGSHLTKKDRDGIRVGRFKAILGINARLRSEAAKLRNEERRAAGQYWLPNTRNIEIYTNDIVDPEDEEEIESTLVLYDEGERPADKHLDEYPYSENSKKNFKD